MNEFSLTLALKQHFNPIDLPWLVAALRHQPEVWTALQDETLLRRSQEHLGAQAVRWSPGALALLTLEQPELIEIVTGSTQAAIEINLRQRALQAFETYHRAPQPADLDLPQAGLLALALRERQRRMKSWQGLGRELGNLSNWKLPLTCLVGMLPNPFDVLATLRLPNSSSVQVNWIETVLHCLLGQPLPAPAFQEALFSLLQLCPPVEQVALLTRLQSYRPSDAQTLAIRFLNLEETTNSGGNPETTPADSHAEFCPAQLYARVGKALVSSELNRLAKRPAAARQELGQVRTIATQLDHGLTLASALLAAQTQDAEATLDDWQAVASIQDLDSGQRLEIIWSLLSAGHPQTLTAASQIAGTSGDDPALLIAQAELAHIQSEPERALSLVRQALPRLSGSPITPVAWHSRLADLCLRLNSPAEALTAVVPALRTQPASATVLSTAARAHLGLGQFPEALNHAQLAAVLEPHSTAVRRLLAETLEANGAYSEALAERKTLLAPTSQSPRKVSKGAAALDSNLMPIEPADLRALANCALHAGAPETAQQASLQALELDSSDGLAHALLGQALDHLNQPDSAMQHYRLATQFTPHQPQPWLALAKAIQMQSESDSGRQQAAEILRTAAQASPEAPEVHLRLGELLLEGDLPAQALPALRRAAELTGVIPEGGLHPISRPVSKNITPVRTPLMVQIAARLGETLHRLGHHAEARPALAFAYKAQPQQVKLAQLYAGTLLSLGETRQALAALAVVVGSKPDAIDPYLDYARALLQVGENPEIAVSTLEQVLQFQPGHPEAQALLAEALAAAGKHIAALKQYQIALDSPLRLDPRWKVRLTLGLGHVAIQMGQPETAIVALSEAIQSAPRHLALHQTLAVAYHKASLPEDALSAARRALELAPANTDNLVWFASLALELRPTHVSGLDPRQEAQVALERAAQLAPTDCNLLIRLGQLQFRLGLLEAARQSFRTAAAGDDLTLDQLRQSARGLLDVHDARSAIICLERLRSADEDSVRSEAALEILLDLGEAYRQAGEAPSALQVIDQALQAYPGRPEILKLKAQVHRNLNANEAALACLTEALALAPEDIQIRLALTELYQEQGELRLALDHALQLWSKVAEQSDAISVTIRARAASLAHAMLQPRQARLILAPDFSVHTQGLNLLDYLDYYGLKAELALDAGEEVGAARAINQALQADTAQPRILALQARLFARQGDLEQAHQKFQEAQTVTYRSESNLAQRLAMASAALEFGDWSTALEISSASCSANTVEPLAWLTLSSLLVRRAEQQILCSALEIHANAPGSIALGSEASQLFDTAIDQAHRLLGLAVNSSPADTPEVLLRWRTRGMFVFAASGDPRFELALNTFRHISPSPADQAAYLAALRKIGRQAESPQAEREFPHDPQVLTQLTLTLLESQPVLAMETALAAIERSPADSLPNAWVPAQHALLALAARQAGEYTQAYQAIRHALGEWSTEPGWQALAAELCQALGDLTGAIQHLEKAASLLPNNPAYFLALGKTYQQAGALAKAIQSFEALCALTPNDPYAWMTLARLHIQRQDLAQAASSAERAIQLAPRSVEALLLRSEIALSAGDAPRAELHAQAAVSLDDQDARAHTCLARALKAQQRPAEAIAAYEKALPHASEPLPIHLERAELIRKSHGAQAALEALNLLANQYPDEPTVLAPLSEALLETGRSEAALQIAQNALHIGQTPETNLDIPSRARLHSMLGRNLRKTGQLDQAIYHLSQALDCQPDQVDTYLELGRAYQDRRQPTQAIKIYQQAMRVAPFDARPYQQAGIALRDNKDYPGAERMIRKAAELAPQDISIQRLLGSLVALNLVQNAQ